MMERRRPRTCRSKNGMVSSASAEASKIGSDILEKGGNAFDAALAVGYALGVSEPQASGIGGQSMALIYLAEEKRYLALDGSSYAPYHFQPDSRPKKPFKVGLAASTLPSTVAFYGYLHDRYGTLNYADLLEPSIRLAEKGFVVSELLASLIEKHRRELIKDPIISETFFKDGETLKAGERLSQPLLASCLRRLSERGWEDFYTGETMRMIVGDMVERDGLLRKEDFVQIPVPIERPVLEGRYRKHGLITFPPPGAGRVLMQIMHILNHFDAQEIDPASVEGNMVLALAFQLTLRDRRRMPQNPDIYFQQETFTMGEKAYAAEVKATIERIIAGYKDREPAISAPLTSGETTHFCVQDKTGNIVAVTQSIELVFGAKRTAKGLGFFYNNYMSAFEYKDRSHPYYLLPRNRPWSSVAPTIVTYRKRPVLVLGSPGSDRISTALAQVLVRYLDYNEDLAEAIDAPRFHTTEKKQLQLESGRFSEHHIKAFKGLGFDMKKRSDYSFYLGCVQAIELPKSKNRYKSYGIADPRRDGSAQGPIKVR